MNRYRISVHQKMFRRYTVYANNELDATENVLKAHEQLFYRPYPNAEHVEEIFVEGFDDFPEIKNIESDCIRKED